MKINYQKNKFLVLSVIILFGSFLRGYNINFNDFWSDEMVSFFLSDPNNSFVETIKLIFDSNLMITFELILKFFHSVFAYNFYLSRYLTLFLSIISIIFFYKLVENNDKLYAALLGIILITINIYHIKYSIELRSYILTFLLAIILLNLIFFKGHIRKNIKTYNYLIIFLITISLLFSHAYSIIILISLNFYLLLIFLFKKNFTKKCLYIFLTITLAVILFLIFYLKNITHTPSWIPELKPSFYSNYFFSTFFGSRLIGGIHLIALFYLTFKFYKKIYIDFDIKFFFVILIILTYLIPITYNYIFEPILIDRYIFYVLIPIFFLLSSLTIKIKKKSLKYFFIIILIVPSFLNFFTENIFKQFYSKIYPSKPEVKNVLIRIQKSKNFNYSFVLVEKNPHNINLVYENYLKKYSKTIDNSLKYINYTNNKVLPNKFWLIYITDITNKKFVKPIELKKYLINDKDIFNHIEIYQLIKNEVK